MLFYLNSLFELKANLSAFSFSYNNNNTDMQIFDLSRRKQSSKSDTSAGPPALHGLIRQTHQSHVIYSFINISFR